MSMITGSQPPSDLEALLAQVCFRTVLSDMVAYRNMVPAVRMFVSIVYTWVSLGSKWPGHSPGIWQLDTGFVHLQSTSAKINTIDSSTYYPSHVSRGSCTTLLPLYSTMLCYTYALLLYFPTYWSSNLVAHKYSNRHSFLYVGTSSSGISIYHMPVQGSSALRYKGSTPEEADVQPTQRANTLWANNANTIYTMKSSTIQ